jgi:hypothetical protein
MLLDAIVKLRDKIQNMKLGVNREAEIGELERATLRRLPLAAHAAVRGERRARRVSRFGGICRATTDGAVMSGRARRARRPDTRSREDLRNPARRNGAGCPP